MTSDELLRLPEGLPVPEDDGAAVHLAGKPVPSVKLPSTGGDEIDLGQTPGRVVVFAYPRTGRPDEAPLVSDWDFIPGARGCTPQTCGFRDLAAEFAELDCRVFGLSTQDAFYQREMAHRLHLPFPVLSDAALSLTKGLGLPTFPVAGYTLLKRLSWFAVEGRIVRVWYPVFPPNENARVMLDWLHEAFGPRASNGTLSTGH